MATANKTECPNELETMRDLVTALQRPETVAFQAYGKDVVHFVHGAGLTAQLVHRNDVEAEQAAPFERRGTARLQTVESFIAHVKRFADDDTAIFANADRAKPGLVSVIDYHRIGHDGAPRWGRHRGAFDFPLSDEWVAWTQADKKAMSMVEFARFLEDHVTDVLAGKDGLDAHQEAFIDATGGSVASPSTLLALSISLKVNETSGVKQATNLTTGEAQVEFNNTHETTIRGDIVRVPSAFIIAIPVFRGSADAYRMLARLRYRSAEGSLKFWFELWRVQPTFDLAFNEACEKVQAETGLALMYGVPESQ